MKRCLVWLFGLFAIVPLQSFSPQTIGGSVQRDLAVLTKRGFNYRMLDNDVIELTDPLSGKKQLKSLREPSKAQIRSWAAQRGIPVLEIDPNTIDTSKYTGWYNYWTSVPLSNDAGVPLIVGDLNHNRKAELYGIYWDSGKLASNVYEVDTIGVVTFAHQFVPRMGSALQLTDVDKDSLFEVNYVYGDSAYNFEQNSLVELPIHRRFAYAEYEYPGTAIVTREYVGNLDADSLTDFLYRGSERDSLGEPSLATYIAEFSDSLNNFRKRWHIHLTNAESGIGGYEVGDFDSDGWKDFVASDFQGRVWVVENTGDNSYGIVCHDSVPFVNAFYQGAGDIDNDGKQEFFIGATISTGDWTTMFEADNDNHYSPKLVIHILDGGTFDSPQYVATDVDRDGKLELVVCAGAGVYFLKSNTDDQYYLWYLKLENARDGIQFHDFNKDGRKDFIVSKNIFVSPPGYARNYADIYVATSSVSVIENEDHGVADEATLSLPYPNPFNPSIAIEFSLQTRMHVSLAIFDMTGKKVEELLSGMLNAGTYSKRWIAGGKSSGVYICRLHAGSRMIERKLLLIH